MRGIEIEARELRYSYPGGAPALDGVSFSLSAGERAGLVGSNGAGKSTLLMLMTGLILPSSGSIRIAGEELTKGGARSLRKRLGYAFQDPDDQLFMSTVSEDVAFGPRNLGMSEEEIARAVKAALEAVGIERLADRPPFRLSGGEKRAAAIATILSMKPEALLLDEPSAGLDPRARRRLIGILSELPHTKLIATHDMDLVHELCDRVIVLAEGRVAADGPASEILGDAALMERAGLEPPASLARCPHCGGRMSAPGVARAKEGE